VDISTAPSVICDIKTSQIINAGTDDNIYVSFIGSFASSGPHRIGPYERGELDDNKEIILDKQIGELKSFFFQKIDGFDGWMLSTLSCTLQGVLYETTIGLDDERWLDVYSIDIASANEGNGYEPDQAQEKFASPTMEILVTGATKQYSDTGVLQS